MKYEYDGWGKVNPNIPKRHKELRYAAYDFKESFPYECTFLLRNK